MQAIKFLLTTRCNLRCNFCHNEFQGNSKTIHHTEFPFTDQKVVDIISHHPSIQTIKLSGGEPLLLAKQTARIVELSKQFPNIKQRILLSNLAINDPAALLAFIDSGITEVRVNVPHLSASEYSKSVGRDRLSIVLSNCRIVAARCKVRFQKVIQPETESFDQIVDYIEEASTLDFIATIALLVDARSTNPVESFARVASHLSKHYELAETGVRHKRFRSSRIEIVLSRCSAWDGVSDIEEETDIYVIPPGNRMLSYIAGKAY